jgi:hypothetical protein
VISYPSRIPAILVFDVESETPKRQLEALEAFFEDNRNADEPIPEFERVISSLLIIHAILTA